jgi:L-ascorbate metabolism protein UlaG (beta-lactamase superfamily)
MELISELHEPDLALLPMGDHHTMGPREAAVAARLLGTGRVVPIHYGIAPGSFEAVPATFRTALDSLGLRDVDLIELRPGQGVYDRDPGIGG